MATAATDMIPDAVYRRTLSTVNDREDFNFTAAQDEWALVAVNNYEGDGAFRHGLRTNISAKNPFVFCNVGTLKDTRSAGVIAINGYDLPSDTDYTVSEELITFTPSFALQLRNGLPTLSRNSQPVTGTMGTDGVAVGYQISLQKRETLDLRLTIPPEWTYNYDMALLLFGPNGRYHQFDGSGGSQPVAGSVEGENSEQSLTYLVTDPGTYLIVLLNMGLPDNISFQLDVGLNGWTLDPGDLVENTLTRVHTVEHYNIIAPGNVWSAAVVKARDEVDREFSHSLHWPTADSNRLAVDWLTDDSPVGIVAINGRGLPGPDTYYLKELYGSGGTVVPYTIQFDTPSMTLPPNNATTPDALSSSQMFKLYEIDLVASETVDFRLQVTPSYNYDHDLGMYIFPPGDRYYSVSGELPAYASGPVAMSRAGVNTEQNAVFTSAVTGTYSVVIVNFDLRDDIPYTLEVTIQGRSLADDVPLTGDLNDQNRQDLYQFRALEGSWSLVGCRLATDQGGGQWHMLHSTALDTNPIRRDGVGNVPLAGGKKGQTHFLPLGMLAVDGHRLSNATTYFVREEVEGSPTQYVVEMENTPEDLAAPFDNISASFTSSEFLETYVVDLQERDTIDLRLAPPVEHTYPYELGLYVLPPGELYRNMGTEGDVAAMSAPGESRDPTVLYTATRAGEHLVVVANLGSMEDLEVELTYAVNGFPASDLALNTGMLDVDNHVDAFSFDVPFGSNYTTVSVRLPEEVPVTSMTATLHWPTLDSVPLSTLVLTPEGPVGAFVISGGSFPTGRARHFVTVTAEVPEGRTLPYQLQLGHPNTGLPGGLHNLTAQDIGVTWVPVLTGGSTADLALRMPPDYTYTYDLGLYLFGPDETYMSTTDVEAGPLAWSRNGPGTEQEVIFTSRRSSEYGVLVLNHASLGDLSYELSATVDGRSLTEAVRAYVDPYNRHEHYRFTAEPNTWAVLASAHVSGPGALDMKLLTNGLSTNPVSTVGVDAMDNAGVIAVNGFAFEDLQKALFVNMTHADGAATVFAVHAEVNGTDFGPIGHVESGQFTEDQVAFLFLVDLQTSDSLEISLDYDQANWSSDVWMELRIFKPLLEYNAVPVETIGLKVTEGARVDRGTGTYVADFTGVHAFVLVNRGPLGPMGFSMGVYRRSVVDLPPMYPAILGASSSTDSITAEWAPNQQADFDRYEVWLSTESNDKGDKIDTITTQSASRYTVTGLDPGHKYYVTIEVYNTAGLSTASDPYAVKTKDLPLYREPVFWVLVLTIVVAIVAIVGIDWFIRRQKAATAVSSEAGTAVAAEATPEDVGPEVEGPEEEATVVPERPPPREKAVTSDRQEAVDFMRQMMGDEE